MTHWCLQDYSDVTAISDSFGNEIFLIPSYDNQND
jgi:hypothetical protein